MDIASGIKLSGSIISIAHYLGLSPYRWNSRKRRVERIDTFSKNCRWVVTLTLSIGARLSYFLSTLVHYKLLNTRDPGDFLQILLTVMCFITLIFDFHTIWKLDQLMRMMNTFHVYQRRFSRRFGRRDLVERRQLKSRTAVLAIMSLFMGIVCLSPVLYKLAPQCHILAGLLPWKFVAIESWSLPWIPWRVAMVLLQLTFGLALTSSAWFYTLLSVPMCLFAFEVGNELRNRDTENWTTPNICKLVNGVRIHSAWRIMTNQLQECLINFLYPCMLVCNTWILIFLLVCFIKTRLPLSVFLLSLQTGFLIITYSYCCVYILASCLVRFNDYVDDISKDPKARNRYVRQIHRSIQHLEIHIGQFSILSMQTCTFLAKFVMEWTLNILITM